MVNTQFDIEIYRSLNRPSSSKQLENIKINSNGGIEARQERETQQSFVAMRLPLIRDGHATRSLCRIVIVILRHRSVGRFGI